MTRRMIVQSSVFGLLAAAIPNIIYSKNILKFISDKKRGSITNERYPAIPLEIASEVVGASHFDLIRVQELVDARPELAKANWDWGFGDWESAIAAASHTGRKDIVEYLVSRGAVPTIFTYAMLGAYDPVKAMVDFYPGIQKNLGPHGISLLKHAKLGLETEGVNQSKAQQLVDYIVSLGNADGEEYLKVEEAEKEKYLGDYRYGDRAGDGFTIKLNMKKILSLGVIGKSGGALYRIGENQFTYNGAPSVIISFEIQDAKVISLTLNEPGLTLTAKKM